MVMAANEVFDDYERDLFTRVVAVAEKAGKRVSLLVVPTNDALTASSGRRGVGAVASHCGPVQ